MLNTNESPVGLNFARNPREEEVGNTSYAPSVVGKGIEGVMAVVDAAVPLI